MPRSPVVLEKQPWAQKLFDFDFTSVFADPVITAATILPPELVGGGSGSLSVSDVAWSGARVQGLFSGGTDGERYLITCRANTASERDELEGILVVLERA